MTPRQWGSEIIDAILAIAAIAVAFFAVMFSVGLAFVLVSWISKLLGV